MLNSKLNDKVSILETTLGGMELDINRLKNALRAIDKSERDKGWNETTSESLRITTAALRSEL